jgi:hypothetical protein
MMTEHRLSKRGMTTQRQPCDRLEADIAQAFKARHDDPEAAGLDEAIREHKAEVVPKAKSDVHRQSVFKAFVKGLPGGVAGAGGGAAEAGGKKPPRKFVPKVADGYTKEGAQTLVPLGYRIHKDLEENRWRIMAPGGGGKSKSYGTGTGLSDYDAMKTVILVVWADYTNLTGEACPWNFEAEAPLVLVAV